MTEEIQMPEVKPRLYVNYGPDESAPDLVAWFRVWWSSRMYQMLQTADWVHLTGEPPPPDQDWWQHLEHG